MGMADLFDDDSFLEGFIRKPGEPVEDWRIQDFDNAYEELIKHPFFMKELPKDLAQYPELAALQSMLYDGAPDEVATNFKNQGNEAYADTANKNRLDDALIWYSKGLKVEGISGALRATLFLNRAAVLIAKEHYYGAICDSLNALKLDSTLAKGHYRCAKALLLVGKPGSAKKFVQAGLEFHPADTNLLQLQATIEQALGPRAQLTPQVEEFLRKRGIQNVSSSEWICSEVENPYPFSQDDVKIKKDFGKNYLSFPIVFFYPHYQQTDFVADCDERATVTDYAEFIFLERASWDTEHLYKSGTVFEAYYECYNPTHPISMNIKLFPSDKPLCELLVKKDFSLVDGVCNIILVPKNQIDHLQLYTVVE